MAFPPNAGRGVTQVIDRCEAAKTNGYLDLSSCSLMYIADAIYLVLKGYEVTKVSLRDNDLKKFPKKMVGKFPNTVLFNIEKNALTEIPPEFGEWTSMRGINAANNQLSEFPDGIFSMKELAILDLSGNNITGFDVDRLLSCCPKLVQLNLSGNPLVEETAAQIKAKAPSSLKLQL